jgi:hypothetical protein
MERVENYFPESMLPAASKNRREKLRRGDKEYEEVRRKDTERNNRALERFKAKAVGLNAVDFEATYRSQTYEEPFEGPGMEV